MAIDFGLSAPAVKGDEPILQGNRVNERVTKG
jgi:hypothetical protein